MRIVRDILLLIVASAVAALVAVGVEVAANALPIETSIHKQDTATLLMLFVVIHLCATVAFVVVQARIAAAVLSLDYRRLMALCTICGPLVAMSAYMVDVRLDAPASALVCMLAAGQILFIYLALRTRSTRSMIDDSSQSLQ